MHRNASARVLPGLVLTFLVATLTLFGAASTAGTPHPQLSGSMATSDVLALHDKAAVQRSTAVATQPLPVPQPPVTTTADPQRTASPQFTGTGSGLRPAAEPGADASSTVQGRAPPASVR